MNTDVSGLGVRISFYMQTLFLGEWVVSIQVDHVISSLSKRVFQYGQAPWMRLQEPYTPLQLRMLRWQLPLLFQDRRRCQRLVFTSTSPFINRTAFTLADKCSGLVVFYLLSMSWFTVIFTIPTLHRFDDNLKFLKMWSIAQSYVVFVFAFILIVRAHEYGSSPACNPHAVVVLFRPFSALRGGRILGWLVTVSVVSVYSFMTGLDYFPPRPKKKVQEWITQTRNRKMKNLRQEVAQELPEVATTPNIPETTQAVPIPEPTVNIMARYQASSCHFIAL